MGNFDFNTITLRKPLTLGILMNPMLKKLVDTHYMTEIHATYIEESLQKKESFIVSGHKGWGILPLLATLGTVAKTIGTVKQVKSLEDLDPSATFTIVTDAKDVEFSKLIFSAMAQTNSQLIAIKDPDHSYSFYKLLGDVFKLNNNISKVYNLLECAKIGEDKKLSKITKVVLDNEGKAIKTNI